MSYTQGHKDGFDINFCQFLGEESQRRHEEDGKVVLVTENRTNENDPNQRGHLVIKGTSQRYIF